MQEEGPAGGKVGFDYLLNPNSNPGFRLERSRSVVESGLLVSRIGTLRCSLTWAGSISMERCSEKSSCVWRMVANCEDLAISTPSPQNIQHSRGVNAVRTFAACTVEQYRG